MVNKRGIIGGFIALFVATIVIAIILISFIVLSGVVKAIERGATGEKVYEDEGVGVGEVRYYMINYNGLVSAEKFVKEGKSVEEAFEQVYYKESLSEVYLEQNTKVNQIRGMYR